MMSRFVTMVGLAVVAAGMSGCLVMQDPNAPVPATQDDIRYLRAEIQRQQNHIRMLEEQLGQLNGELAQERYNQSSASAGYATTGQIAALNEQVAALRQQLGAVDAARVKDRDELMSSMSKTIATAVKKSQPPPQKSGGGVKATGTHSGIEHVVQSGETLSAIAQAYGVKTSTILEYNDIANPALIRVGQTLFIPQ